MRDASRILTAAFVVGLLSGAAGTKYLSPRDALRGLAGGAENKAPLNDFKRLECLSEERYREVSRSLNLNLAVPADHCLDPLHGKLSKVLQLMERTRPRLPADWAPTLHANLGDPVGFLARMTGELDVDLSQTNSIAKNKTDERKISLGGRFFVDTPLESISTLIHEARHSHPNDPGHALCQMGNIPRAEGGCDAEFSVLDSTAGAYSYGTAYYMALAEFAPGLSEGDREFLRTAALVQLGSRFNRISPELALRFDLLVGLGRDGDLRAIHPFTGSSIPVGGRKFKRIKFNVLNNGVMAFTPDDRILSWSWGGGFEIPFKDELPGNEAVLEWDRIRLPFGDYPYNTFLGRDNSLTHIRFSPDEGRMVRSEVDFHLWKGQQLRLPQIRTFGLGMAVESFFLATNGVLFVGKRLGSEEPVWARPELNTRPWSAFSGGVLHESLHLLDLDGRLHSATRDWDSRGDLDTVIYPLKTVETSLPALSGYEEGLNLRVALDREGQVHVSPAGQSAWSRLSLSEPLSQLVVTRQLLASGGLLKHLRISPEFARCGTTAAVVDPWLEGGIGLDARGRLVFGFRSSRGFECVRSKDAREYRSIRIGHDRLPDENPDAFPVPVLELETAEGRKVLLRPYE